MCVRNSQGEKVKITLEPWADEYLLLPGQKVRLAFSGPEGGELEFETRGAEVVIYGWSGSTFVIRES